MQWHIDRYACNFMAELGELHTPRQRCWLSPAAAGGKATKPSKEIPQRNCRSARVRRLPPGQLVALHQEIASEHSAEQAAVENSTRTQKIQRDQLQRMIAILRFGEEHQHL